MKIKKITYINGDELFGDIATKQGNYVLANSDIVIHNSHIATLLTIIFLKLMPDVIKNGHLYYAQGPLYGGQIKDKFTPFYTEEDKEKFIKENPNSKIQRYKGLGEMNALQLKICLIDEQTRKLIQIPYPEDENDIKYLFDLMIKAELKRELV